MKAVVSLLFTTVEELGDIDAEEAVSAAAELSDLVYDDPHGWVSSSDTMDVSVEFVEE